MSSLSCHEKAKELWDLGDVDSALFWARKASSLDPHSSDRAVFVARLYMGKGEYQPAVELLLSHEPKEPMATVLLARCYATLERWEEVLAVAECEGSLLLQKETLPFTYQSQLDALRGQALEQLGSPQDAAHAYTEAISRDPCNSSCVNKLAQHEHGTEIAQRAADVIAKQGLAWITDVYPVTATSKPTFLMEHDLDYIARRASDALRQHHYGEALKLANRGLDLHSLHRDCLVVFLIANVNQGETNALFCKSSYLMEAVPRSGGQSQDVALFAVGCYYLSIDNMELASTYFGKAVAQNGSFVEAHISHGYTLSNLGEFDRSLSCYQAASKLMGGERIAQMYIGMDYSRSGNSSLALQYIEKNLLAERYRDPFALSELGAVQFKANRVEEALASFQEALDIIDVQGLPLHQWEPVLFNMGHAYRKLGMFENAIQCYRKCVQLAPSNAASCYQALGLAYHIDNQFDRAIEYYHKVCLR